MKDDSSTMSITQWIQYDTQTGIITIDTGSKENDSIKVQRLDSYGSICEKLLLQQNGTTLIDTGSWLGGTWFIRVEKKQEVQLKRILISK